MPGRRAGQARTGSGGSGRVLTYRWYSGWHCLAGCDSGNARDGRGTWPGGNRVHNRAQAWYGRRTWHWRDWPAEVLLEGKRRAGARISVVIPARNEERTIAGVVGSLRAALVDRI